MCLHLPESTSSGMCVCLAFYCALLVTMLWPSCEKRGAANLKGFDDVGSLVNGDDFQRLLL